MGGSGHMPNTRCGGMSSPGEPDQEVQDLCNKVGMIDSSNLGKYIALILWCSNQLAIFHQGLKDI